MRSIHLLTVGLLLAPSTAQAGLDCNQAARAMWATTNIFNQLVEAKLPEYAPAYIKAKQNAVTAIDAYAGSCSSWISENHWSASVAPGRDPVVAQQQPSTQGHPPPR